MTHMRHIVRRGRIGSDAGMVLILTLVVVVILGASVVALARYATVNLRYGDVSESAARRRAAADGALTAVVDQIRVGVAPCLYDDDAIVAAVPAMNLTIEGIVPTATCRSLDGPIDATQAWAAVITGEGVGSNGLIRTGTDDTTIEGRLWMSSAIVGARTAIADAVTVAGPLVHADSTGCPVLPGTIQSDITFSEPLVDRPVCVGTGWQDQPSFAAPLVPDLEGLPNGSFVDGPNCRVFQPGVYDDDPFSPAPDLPDTAGKDTYFAPGDYRFKADGATGADWAIRFGGGSGVDVVAGKHPLITPQDLGGWGCAAELDYANASFPVGGVTFYLDGRAHIVIEDGADLEIMPRPQSGDLPVSVQALATSAHTANPIPDTANSNRSVIRIADEAGTRVRIHGLVHAPLAQVRLEGTSDGGRAVDIWGGLVAARLWSEVRTVVRPSTPSTPAPIHLLVTAEATLSGDTTRMQANVTYDPTLAIEDRATVTAWHLCDTTC